MSWPAGGRGRPRHSSTEDEYHEDPVPDLCLVGLTPGPGTGPGSGPTRPPDVLLPLHDPDWPLTEEGSGSSSSSWVEEFDLDGADDEVYSSVTSTSPRLAEAHIRAGGTSRVIYTDLTTEVPATSPSTDSGVADAFNALSPEEQEKQREEWKLELARVEEDIVLMRETLSAKIKEAQELKHKLGITMWTEFTQDVNQGLKNVKESQAYHKVTDTFTEFQHAVTSAPIYQKTEAALKTTGEKASGLFAGLGAKIHEARESATFKSVEERVGSMVSTVKSKVSTSRSNSTQSFDEALKEAEAAKKQAEGANSAPAGGDDKPPQ